MKKCGIYFDAIVRVPQEVHLKEGINMTREELIDKLNQGLIISSIKIQKDGSSKLFSFENGNMEEIGYIRSHFLDNSRAFTEFKESPESD